MTPQTTLWLVLGGILMFVVIEDPKIYHWLVLVSEIVNIWIKRQWFLIKNHPDTPWVRYSIKRNADINAKKLWEELNANK